MISGAVKSLTPIVPLAIEDSSGDVQQYQVALDTGFGGFLSLPPADIRRLRLAPLRDEVVELANGRPHRCRTYMAIVHWHDDRYETVVYEMGVQPLLGMRLLNGSRIGIDVAEGGPVSVEPL